MSGDEHGSATLRVLLPLEISVRALAPEGVPAPVDGRAEAMRERARTVDDYRDRAGYDESFLRRRVPLPILTAKGMRRVSHRVDVEASDDDHLLHYHHFTVVMNRVRRFCYFTAANTTRDPALVGTKKREELDQTWRWDPRIPREHQVEHEEFYRPAVFDRGHVHRREDGYWGATEEEREAGSADTFHYTNATPQHPRFNQSRQGGEWGELENHIADEVGSQRFSLFAGPVFHREDPPVQGLLVPRRFWKVVVARRGNGLGAWAFLLDQSHLPFERFDAGAFENRQVSVEFLESLVDVRFPSMVHDADVLRGTTEAVAIESLGSIRGLR